jgi:hypothetical protein
VSLNTSDEELISICCRVLNEVRRSLFGRNSNERNTFIGGLEPNDLGPLDRGTGGRLITFVAFALATLSLLLLFGRGRGWTKQTQSTREKLPRHSLNNGNNMTSKLRFNIISNPEGPS